MGYESEMDCRTCVDKYHESLALLDVGHSDSSEEAMNALMNAVGGWSPSVIIPRRVVYDVGKKMDGVRQQYDFGSKLPDELIVQILSMLPAKSLLRCRLVCKSWLNLINSTEFKLMHLHNFNQLNPRCFVRRLLVVAEECYDVHLDDEAFTFDDSTQIELPLLLVSTCVLGLSDVAMALFASLMMITLSKACDHPWNPSIRRKLTIPLPMVWYDKMSDDYKVVSLAYDECSSTTRPQVVLYYSFSPILILKYSCNLNHLLLLLSQVKVYTVKTGIWRKVVIFNGSVHWIAWDPTPGVSYHSIGSHYSIMTFDITTELFGEIQLPEFSADGLLMVSYLENLWLSFVLPV
ncbi:LOW QUALITY PROTEIN: hypothetical protein OSB04_013423 [Centaurea solstitialis]|uniref:F-box domain-containing protein n=1 Tax=Centaurea solstitialis TaxID=347529 RepID=A0AA38TD99_9ASTR|nr:LOW QUALITY PROTEIN: hypothetical protein OSB04_013423 [Centaurea solstitialis]